MENTFTARITPYVEVELAKAAQARVQHDPAAEFSHLERAHVVGQASTYWHVRVHGMMLIWGLRNRSAREVWGQLMRIAGAATKTVFGLVPKGNTGGANVSPFATMPLDPELASFIRRARSGL
jgi:hypothetical protein